MKERPILFSAPMVRALLAGTKTVTRRTGKTWARAKAGDTLWIRETFFPCACGPEVHRAAGRPPGTGVFYRVDDALLCAWCKRTIAQARVAQHAKPTKWTPSIHMHRYESRLTREIVNVRREPLHAITDDDVLAEGLPLVASTSADDPRIPADKMRPWMCITAPASAIARGPLVSQYAALWDELHGRGAWDANPDVYRVQFEPVST